MQMKEGQAATSSSPQAEVGSRGSENATAAPVTTTTASITALVGDTISRVSKRTARYQRVTPN